MAARWVLWWKGPASIKPVSLYTPTQGVPMAIDRCNGPESRHTLPATCNMRGASMRQHVFTTMLSRQRAPEVEPTGGAQFFCIEQHAAPTHATR